MTKRAKLGGIVMISRKLYEVVEAPVRDHNHYRIRVRPKEGGPTFVAVSEDWRCGCGPWKLAPELEAAA